MRFIIDNREKKPYTEYFDKGRHSYEIRKLETGDYSLEGYETEFAIERKTLPDFLKSITQNRLRFENELRRSQSLKSFYVILEFSLFDLYNKNYTANVKPTSAINTIFKWTEKHKTPFLFCDSRKGGAVAVICLADGFLKYRNEIGGQNGVD